MQKIDHVTLWKERVSAKSRLSQRVENRRSYATLIIRGELLNSGNARAAACLRQKDAVIDAIERNRIIIGRCVLLDDQVWVFDHLGRGEGEARRMPIVRWDQIRAANSRHLLAGQVREAEAIEQESFHCLGQRPNGATAVLELTPPAVVRLDLEFCEPCKNVSSRILNAS